jgi:hypothetical protein
MARTVARTQHFRQMRLIRQEYGLTYTLEGGKHERIPAEERLGQRYGL